MHPFHEKLILWKALVTLAVILALALLIMCPQLSHSTVDAHNFSNPLSCWEAPPEKGMGQVLLHRPALLAVCLAPPVLLVDTYACITRRLGEASAPTEQVRRRPLRAGGAPAQGQGGAQAGRGGLFILSGCRSVP